MFIDVIEKLIINGVRQCISIRAQKQNAPLLLYLHGGPGDAALPMALKYNSSLEDNFTVVVWEQRGAGKSYYKFRSDEKITIDTFVRDAFELTRVLLERFQQQKLYLVGHSWGSVIGLKFIAQYPTLVHTYVGCGQVVNMMKSSKTAYEFALKKNMDHSKSGIVEKIKAIDYTYSGENWLKDLLFITGEVVRYQGSLYGKTNYNSFVRDCILSPKYGIRDLLNHQSGSLQSIKFLWQELMTVNFEPVTSYDVPVVFIEGRHDSHVSSRLVYEYYEGIKTEKQFYWFEQSGHFPQWSESEKFNEILTGLL